MNISQNDYFDEAYFQRGEERGTAYRNYAQAASESLTFKEIAEALIHVFRPKKALEIGCATGAIVRALNDLGVDAHGIDVSDWAVQNSLHPNVAKASADNLPFGDGSFDLIYSSHALEHVPMSMIDSAISEISRVSKASAQQFHMLPIIGTFPYDYDPDLARQNLSADPTHNILETRDWWLARWELAGWHPAHVNILLLNDTNGGELSSGQFTLTRGKAREGFANRVFEWNLAVHRRQLAETGRRALEIAEFRDRMSSPTVLGPQGSLNSELFGVDEAPWNDFSKHFAEPADLTDATVEIAVDLISNSSRPLRIALVDEAEGRERGVLEFWTEFQPGLSAIHVPVDQFTVLQGDPRVNRITNLFFGGNLDGAKFRVSGSIKARRSLIRI